jgi:hypothetical protein
MPDADRGEEKRAEVAVAASGISTLVAASVVMAHRAPRRVKERDEGRAEAIGRHVLNETTG